LTYDYDFLGFGIKSYRSFYPDAALVGPFNKVHLITGCNNSGKSALADVALKVLPLIQFNGSLSKSAFANNDIPEAASEYPTPPFVLSLCFKLDALMNRKGIKRLNAPLQDKVRSILCRPQISRGFEGACWFDFDMGPSAMLDMDFSQDWIDNLELCDADNLEEISLEMFHSSSSDLYSNVNMIFRHIIPWESIPKVIKVSAIREATSEQNSAATNISSGRGLNDELLKLSNPHYSAQKDSEIKWRKFIAFVRNVVGDENADVMIPYDASEIQVRTDGAGYLPLASLGTGIEELVIIGAAATCNSNALLIIEEPEIHLHPTLQAKLAKYFQEDTNGNRFLITTHSPTIINASNASITHVTKAGSASHARTITTKPETRDMLDDIGAHPSDLLQANYVIWVEGPSDRIYMNYWLSQIAPDLIEGIDYTVMIYGGKLLNGLSADWEDAAEDLISLFNINSHFCVLMDSDRDKPSRHINKTKQRIVEECKKSHCMSWVTDGRTIENYVPEDTLAEALAYLYPDLHYTHPLGDEYTYPLSFTFTGKKYGPAKIKVARYVAQHGYVLSSELQNHVKKLVRAIKAANQ
jgi:ABC-type dipeptide/oligopeptide/nickel transport system ATPase component